VHTVENIVGKRGRVAVREELSIDLLELGFGKFAGGTVLQKAFVPRLKFSLVKFSGLLQLLQLLRAQFALSGQKD
jgi:hypothetical protein